MNEQLKIKAEQIFREKYRTTYDGLSFEAWLSYNDFVYHNIIIPSIIQALDSNYDNHA